MAAQGGSAGAANDAFYPNGNPDTVVATKEDRHHGGTQGENASHVDAEASLTGMASLTLQGTKDIKPSNEPKGKHVDEATGMLARPAYGTIGEPFIVSTNYRKIKVPTDLTIWPYKITILGKKENEVDANLPKRKHRRVIELLLEKFKANMSHTHVATDFFDNLYSSAKLPWQAVDIVINHRLQNEPETSLRATSYRVKLALANSMEASAALAYLHDGDADPAAGPSKDLIQALNIIFNHHAKLRSLPIRPEIMMSNSSSFFAINGGLRSNKALGGGLEAWKGVFSSVRPATSRLLLNTQVQHAAAYVPGPLPNLMEAHLDHNGTSLSRLDEKSLLRLERFLKGVRVKTNHLAVEIGSNRQQIVRPKTIWGLALKKPEQKGDSTKVKKPLKLRSNRDGSKEQPWDWKVRAGQPPVPRHVGFDKSNGKKLGQWVSVFDHFKDVYKREPLEAYPVVNVGNDLYPVFLPAEVCEVLPGQPARANLSSEQTREMVSFAVCSPQQNQRRLLDTSLPILGIEKRSDPMSAFGLSVGHGFVKVPARLLAPPEVVYGGGTVEETKAGAWNMKDKKYFKGARLQRWMVLCLLTGDRQTDSWYYDGGLVGAIKSFKSELKNTGMTIWDSMGTHNVTVRKNPNGQYDLGAIKAAFFIAGKKNPELIVTLMSSFNQANKPIYNKVKRIGDIDQGVHTVLAYGHKFVKRMGSRQYFANLGLKVNLKFGGQNHAMDPEKLSVIAEGKTMVVGLDVSHPSPGSREDAPSVVAIVASVDSSLGQFPAAISSQNGREEVVSGLGDLLIGRLRMWEKRNNGSLPEAVILYRDGVSEGQFASLIPNEIGQIKAAFTKHYGSQPQPKLAVVVCGKRHKTRFYAEKEYENDLHFSADKRGNVAPGTVVDRGITEARRGDFYLVPHKALQGTAQPCHYDVVHDEIFRVNDKLSVGEYANSSDVLQDLTHNLCYLFGRATKAVSLCPPAKLADLLCTRIRVYMASVFDVEAVDELDGLPNLHANIADSMFYI